MGEARRRRLAGEGPHLPDTLAAGDARDMPGHLRLTVLDDDDRGMTAYYKAEELTDHLDRIGGCRPTGRRVRDLGATTEGWAKLRAWAFEGARDPALRLGAAELALWCVMNGPQGPAMRRAVSEALARDGKATVVMRRHRPTGGVATTVMEEPDEKALTGMAELAAEGGRMPGGKAFAVVPADILDRQEH
jgi:hypothetical protein